MSFPYLQIGGFCDKYQIIQFSWKTGWTGCIGTTLVHDPWSWVAAALFWAHAFQFPSLLTTRYSSCPFEPVPPRLFTWLAQLLGASVLGMSNLHGLFGGKKLGRPSCILRLFYGSQGDAVHHKMPRPTTKSWYHQMRRNFWNKGKGHILSHILSNFLRICCLILQWMDIVPSTIYKMSLSSGARVSMPFDSCVTLG